MQSTIHDLIRSRDKFVLTGHEHPDGDCVGAEVALYHLLRGLGKQVHVLNPDPVGRALDFVLEHTPIRAPQPGEELPQAEVVVLLDCCQLARVGWLGEKLAAGGATVAVIDHHVGSDCGDGQVLFVDSTAASTGSMVYRLYRDLQVPLTRPAAEGVFLSLVSDTGWFRYSNTDPEVLALAAELLAAGVDCTAMYDRIFRRNHPDSLTVLSDALRASRLELGGRFGYTIMDRTLMDRAGRADFDTDLVLDPLRSVEGVEVVALFKERFDGAVKLSLRASGDVDVQAIAATFGGGGHKKAAGATLSLDLTAAVAAVREQVEKALSELQPKGEG